MNIYILRHAIAVERGTPGYEDDSLRPLTPEGTKKMLRNAIGIKALNLSFDLILSSPYVRAKQTAEILTQTLQTKQSIILTKNLIPEAPFKDLLSEINSTHAINILLVGHEPHLGELISYLLKGDKTSIITLKKGGFCCLTIQTTPKAGSANLQWLLTPSQLRLIK